MFCPNHWNGLRLRNEPANRHGDRGRLLVFPTEFDTVTTQFGNAKGVFVGFGGKTGQEVQLHPAPALAVRRLDGTVEVFFPNELVDDLAHPPGTGLWGEGEAGASGALKFSGDPDGESIDPQRRKGDGDLPNALVRDGVGDDPLDSGEVGGGERRERHLVVAGALETFGDHAADLLGRAFPNGAGDHPRLTETAATSAAPEDLDRKTIVHYLGHRNELLLGVGPVAEVGNGALLDLFGHVWVAGRDSSEELAVVTQPRTSTGT